MVGVMRLCFPLVLKGLWSVLLSMSNTNFFNGEDGMYGSLNERSELERFRDRHESNELSDMVDRYKGLWVEAFRQNHEDRVFPLHPWKILKYERRAFAELEGSGDWPSLGRRHALRVVKDEYVEKWRNYSASFEKSQG